MFMEDEGTGNQNSKMLGRLFNALGPTGKPIDDRGRMRKVVDNLVLHLHPTKVPRRTLRWSYTWGLGGLSGLLLMVLIITGLFLEMNYTPSPSQAYLDILALRTNTWFGDLLRNIHHWSANLLVVVATLHLLRVFFTGGHRPPRATNWIVGVVMLLLVLGANFTGYLLPWDQLAYWAITVGTSLLTYIPVIGIYISRLLLGGPEVSAATLLNFYALHISFIPGSIILLMSLHFWRVRKDGGLTLPKDIDEKQKPPMERVTTIPHLVRRELVFALVWLVIIIVWAMLLPAPLEGIANPQISPNPAKSPWYFLGIQELLLHFHPVVGAVIIPGLALAALVFLPFYDFSTESVGVYFRSRRGRYLSLMALGFGIMLVPIWVVLDEFVLHWADWLPSWPSLISNGLIPLAIVLLGLIGMDEVIKRTLKANKEERVLFLFNFLLVALILLTLTGIFFRGPGMSLYWPWKIPLAH
jgi:quinol-cytochrome oxidoreductase complex cytochrome b subunit